MWGEEEKAFLEDLTMNLVPDDENLIKGKTVMRWDSKKKRHVLVKVDRDGRVMKEKRNEAGVKITKKNAEKLQEQKVYKNWMKKTHMKLQTVGEVENTRSIDVAKSSNDSRKMMKQFRSKHAKELNTGEDARSNKRLVEMKKRKMMEKSRNGKKEGNHGKKYGDKTWKKIVHQSAPTRSKVIMKRRK